MAGAGGQQPAEPARTDDRPGALAAFRGLLLFAAVALTVWAFGLIVWPFRLPIAWALCLGAVTLPAYRRLESAWGSPRWAAIAMVLLVLVGILGPVIGIGLMVIDEAEALDLGPLIEQVRHHFPNVYQGLEEKLRDWGIKVPAQADDAFAAVNTALQENLPQVMRTVLTGPIGDNLLGLVAAPFVFLFGLVIALVTLYFVYCDSRRLSKFIVDLSPLAPSQTDRVLQTLRGTISAAILGGILVALLQGALGAVMFAIADLPSPVLWGLVMAVCSLFPFGGTALVWVPAAVYLFVTGSVGMGIFVTVMGLFVVGTVDNLLRPWVMTRTGAHDVHPMLLFFAILSGIGLFGISGIVFGPLLLAFLTTIVRIYREHGAAQDAPGEA